MDFVIVLAIVIGWSWLRGKLTAPATVDKHIFITSMVELWKRNYPDYSDNLASLPPDMQVEHLMRVDIAFGDLVESVAIAGQSKTIWPFRFKEWMDFALGFGMPVEAIAEQCKAPVFAVRSFMVYNKLVEFNTFNEVTAFVLKGKVPEYMVKPKKDMSEFIGQDSFEGKIYLKKKNGMRVPADDIITGE